MVEAKTKKTQSLSKTTTDKQISSLVPEVKTAIAAIDNHMAIIQVHTGNNMKEDVLLDGGSGINIITK